MVRNMVLNYMGAKYFQECGPNFLGVKHISRNLVLIFMGETYFQEFGPTNLTWVDAESNMGRYVFS